MLAPARANETKYNNTRIQGSATMLEAQGVGSFTSRQLLEAKKDGMYVRPGGEDLARSEEEAPEVDEEQESKYK